jgi:tetratricopeptide (TPR) repeat protein
MRDERRQDDAQDSFSEFIKRNRKGIYITMCTIIVLLVGVIVYFSFNSYFQKKAIAEVEELNSKYAEIYKKYKEIYINDEDLQLMFADENYIGEVNELLDKLNVFVKGKSQYAGARGWTIIAQIYSGREDWPNAEEAWRNAAKTGVKTYLAPAAYFNAAAAAENQGKIDEAIRLLEKSVTYKFDFPAAPRAQFSIGRLNEQRGNIPEAIAAYRAILVNEQWSKIETWVNLAQSRIIAIEE